MKIKLLSCVLILLLALPLMAAPRKDGSRSATTSSLQVDNTNYIDANKILMFVTNHGNFGRDLADVFGYDYGTFFPFTSVGAIEDGSNVKSPNYASGLWIGGVDQATGDTLIAIAEYSDEYVPGPMAGGTFQADNPNFRVFKLYSDSLGHPNSAYNSPNDTLYTPNQDWYDFMTYALPAGADTPWVYDTVYLDDSVTIDYVDTVPKVLGDQYMWSVFNDADPAQHSNDAGETAPLGIEVRQEIFAYNREDPLGNCVFMRLRVFNKGAKTIENCFLSLWADPDLGGAGDDLVGCDTTLSLGFVYNDNNQDQKYGSRPPCMGFDFFQGPMVGSPGDSAKMWGQYWQDSTNLGMVSFNKYINGTDPDNYQQTYQYMNGLDGANNGAPYIYNGNVNLYQNSGDPVLGTGDLDIAPADRRWMQSTGPITFAPGDSTEILAAIVVGLGGDRLSSISVMKYYDKFAQSAYDINFDLPEPPARPIVTVGELDGELTLTWTNVSETSPGDYPFQGYSVYQGETPSGPWTLIANYDIIDGTAQIQDDVLDPLTGALEHRLVKQGTDSGIRRYFVVDQDYLLGGPLRNLTKYYFRVEAYSYDPAATPVTLTSANRTPIELVPQERPPDVTLPVGVGSDVTVTHTTGASGGVVTVEVIDPLQLTGDNYRVVFFDTTVIDSIVLPDTFTTDRVYWNLVNATTNTTLLSKQFNQSGDDDYQVTEGFVVRVSGPPPGFGSFQVVANGAGPIDPPEAGAFDFGGFPVPLDANGDPLRPTANQQVGDGLWGIHTADNGGTCDGGDRGSYSAFISRTTRDGANNPYIGAYDFEMRFTGDTANPGVNGSYAIEWFNDDNVFWVPFEIWRTGIGTPNDPSDDVRLIPYIIDDGDDNTYNLESWGCPLGTFGGDGEHSVSGGDNDPFTDWVYLELPVDQTPGEAGYLAAEADMLGASFDGSLVEHEILARVVLVNWNGGDAPPFTQGLPETGTIFRMVTEKPNAPADTFSFATEAPMAAAKSEGALDKITAVPNPFYLFSSYDPSPGSKTLKFHHLPEKCTITIYNLGGTLVRTIEKDDASTAIASWDLLTEAGLPVASGIYIYVVDAPGFGQKIGKVAVLVESEVLQLY